VENRERVSITGVDDVESFNDVEVLLLTEGGPISIQGAQLHISKLNLDDGQLVVEGFIHNVDYLEQVSGKQGFLSKVFG
jgi:sporulation protein YabP